MAIRDHKPDYLDAVTVHVDVLLHERYGGDRHEELITQLDVPTTNLGAGSFNAVYDQVGDAVKNYLANTRPEIGHSHKSDFWYCDRYKTGLRFWYDTGGQIGIARVVIVGFTGASHRRFVGDHRKAFLPL